MALNVGWDAWSLIIQDFHPNWILNMRLVCKTFKHLVHKHFKIVALDACLFPMSGILNGKDEKLFRSMCILRLNKSRTFSEFLFIFPVSLIYHRKGLEVDL